MRTFLKHLLIFVVFPAGLSLAVSCGSKDTAEDSRTPRSTEHRDTAIALLKTAQRQSEKKQYALAHESYRSAIEADPEIFSAHLGFQDSFFEYYDPRIEDQAEEYGRMMKTYRDHARKHGDSTEFQYLYGRLLDRDGSRKEAAEYYRKALEIDYKLFPAHIGLAEIYEQVEISPNLARDHRQKGKKFGMLFELETAVEQNPFDVSTHRLYQDAMFEAENNMPRYYPPGGLMERYKSLLEKYAATDREPMFLYLIGRIYGWMGRTEEARQKFEQASKLRPSLPWPYDGLATYNLKLAMKSGVELDKSRVLVEKSIRLYQKAVRLDPKQVESRLKLLNARMQMTGIHSAYLKKLGRIVAQGGELTQKQEEEIPHHRIKMHDHRTACKNEVLELISQDPKNIEAYLYLAVFACEDGAYLLAQEVCDTALSVYGTISESEARKKSDVIDQVNKLKKNVDDVVGNILTGRGDEAASLPKAFTIEEAGKRMKSESGELRKRTVIILASLCAQIIADKDRMPDALKGDYGRLAQYAVRLISTGMEDGDVEVKLASVRALGDLEISPFAEKVAAILADPNAEPRLRTEAAIALKKMREKDSIPFLVEGLKAENEDIRRFSAEALYGITGRKHGYNYDDPPEKRKKAIAEWKQWWKENSDTFEIEER